MTKGKEKSVFKVYFWFAGGNLAEVLATDGPLSEGELKQVLLQVARGLRYIHSQKLVHLDIKPGNIYCI